ncbi:MAG: hypothetical protein ACXVBE_16355 [Bdellovibrionota bacterium]
MNGAIVLSAESAQKPLEVGSLATFEILVDGKVTDANKGWSVTPPPTGGWFPSGSFLISASSLREIAADGTNTKLSIEGIVRQGGELRTAPFRLQHTGDNASVDVGEATVSKSNVKPVEQPKDAPPWLLPATSLGGWNIWLISILGIILLFAIGYGVRALVQRLALRNIAKWNHRDRALRDLQGLEKYVKAKDHEQDHWKKFSFDLAGILKKYSDENFEMDSRDMTDREFITELKFHQKGRSQADLIAHILSTITEVRYGTKTLESQMMPSLLDEAKRYVNGTFIDKEGEKK